LRELGEYLKRERELRQISLSKIADETKIPFRYLEAIERGDVEKLPGEVYLKGFLRSYALELGLDDHDVLERYRQLKEKEAEGDEEKTVQAKPPKRKKVSWRLRYERAFITLLLLVLLLAALYAAFRPKSQPPPPEVPQSSQQEVPEPEPLPELEEEPEIARSVEIFARDNCWVEAYSQGERLFASMFSPGERREIPVRANLTLLLGKPAAVSLKYGEKAVEGLGKETVTVVFDQEGDYQIHRGRKEDFFR